MIKVTIGGEPQKEKEITYPCLMVGKMTNVVVLFYEKGKGHVVREGKNHTFDSAPSDWNMDHFTLMTEPITLQNITE